MYIAIGIFKIECEGLFHNTAFAMPLDLKASQVRGSAVRSYKTLYFFSLELFDRILFKASILLSTK